MNYYPENLNYAHINRKITFSLVGMSGSFVIYFAIIFFLEKFDNIDMNFQCLKEIEPQSQAHEIELKTIHKERQENRINVSRDFLSNSNSNIDQLGNVIYSTNYHKLFILNKAASGNCSYLDYLSQKKYDKLLKKIPNFDRLESNHGDNSKKSIGYCPEYSPFIYYLNVKENLEYFLTIRTNYTNDEIPAIIDNIMKQFKIDNLQNTNPDELSDGQIKLLKLAISFIGDPSLVIVDDLSSELDPSLRLYLWNLQIGRAHV